MIPKQGWPFFQDFLFPLNTILSTYIKILALFHLQIILENCSYLIWFDYKLKKTSVCLQQPFGLMHFFPDKEMNTKGLWHPWHCKWQPYGKPYYFTHFCNGITEVSKEFIIFFTFFPLSKVPLLPRSGIQVWENANMLWAWNKQNGKNKWFFILLNVNGISYYHLAVHTLSEKWVSDMH